MTRRTRAPLHKRRTLSSLAFAVSLVTLVANEPIAFASGSATATDVVTNDDGVAAFSPLEAAAGSTGPPDIPATGTSSRSVVRIGALLFALGSFATYVAAGSRRNRVREVDLDGRDL